MDGEIGAARRAPPAVDPMPGDRMIELVEVSPRDGLQNEPAVLSTDDKASLILRAEAAGVRRIEAASFVNPARVPQMADAEAVITALPRRPDVVRIGLLVQRPPRPDPGVAADAGRGGGHGLAPIGASRVVRG